MSSRPLKGTYPAIVSGSMSASITSAVTLIQNLSMVSYDISWSGSSPVGVAEVQVSNTYAVNADGSVRTAGSWTTITSSAVSGNSGTGFFDIDAVAAYAIRLVYTRTSGTGTMNATLYAKVM